MSEEVILAMKTPKGNLWKGLRLLKNSFGSAEEMAGSFVTRRIPLSNTTPDGLYLFVVDQKGKVWLSPVTEDLKHSALVPQGAKVRGAGYVALKDGRANVNGRSGHYMAERPFIGKEIALYDKAIRTTFLEQGVEVVDHDAGLGKGVLKPPNP